MPDVEITVNGQSRRVPAGTSVAALMQLLEAPRYAGVEVNLQLVPRQLHAQHVLADGDQLEVMTLTGGG